MSNPEDRNDDSATGEHETDGNLPRAVCRTCGGAGEIYTPKFGMRLGVPGTVHTHQICPQCTGERFLSRLEPPI